MWQKSKPYLLIAPATIFLFTLFIGGMWQGLLESLGVVSYLDLPSLSLEAYHSILQQKDFWFSLWFTFRISIIATFLSGVLGLIVTILLSHMPHYLFWQRLIQLPLTIPHFVAAYFIVLIFMQSGWIARLFYMLGWVDEPAQFPILINDPFGWGIILTYVWKEIPFIVLMVYPVFARIQQQWKEVANIFGANSRQYFREVTFPLVFPVWLQACLIVFAFTFAAFEVPFLLGITYPQTLPVLAYELYAGGDINRWSEALAINVILAFFTIFFGWLAYRFGSRYQLPSEKRW